MWQSVAVNTDRFSLVATSHEQAVPLCEAMRRQGLIHPVGEVAAFADGSALYRFVPQASVN